MKRPKISIIVPVYKVEKYLSDCVSSLLNQTLKDIEIILVDDESPDTCPELCDKYAIRDSRVRVIHKKNEGLGFARNSGLEIATGEYVAFVDSDDYIDLNTYEDLLCISKEKTLDACYFAYEKIEKDGSVSGHNSTKEYELYEQKSEIKKVMLNMIANEPSAKRDRNLQMSSCCAVYRKDIIDKYNILFKSERELISEDLIFNLDFLNNTKRISISKCTYYHYRANPTSLTQTIREDKYERTKFYNSYLLDKLKEIGLYDSGKSRAIRLFIGDSRAFLLSIACSNLPALKKRTLISSVCNDEKWEMVRREYSWWKLPLIPRMVLILIFLKLPSLIIIMGKLK